MNAVVTQDTAVMVLGMHRSGTSVATRVLSLLGADLGDNLLPPQEDNKKGFWEHVEAVDIHERLLASIGRTWHDIRELPRGWQDSSAALLALDEIAGLIRREFAGKRLWAVKDPRMCRLVPLWLTALQRMGIRATALTVVRDPIEVADSLLARDGWSRGHSYVLWARHLAEALLATTGIPRAMLSYNDLLNHWRPCMARVAEQLGLQWTGDSAQAGAAIDEFISPAERHHDFVKESFRRSEVPRFVSDFFQACSDADGVPDWPALEAACEKFMCFSSLFEPNLEELVQARIDFEQLAHERMLRIQQLDQDTARISIERGSLERLAVDRLERIKQLEAEYQAKMEQQARIEGQMAAIAESKAQGDAELSSMVESRAEALVRAALAQETALRAQEETAKVRDELAKLTQLTRNRRWLIKRALGAVI